MSASTVNASSSRGTKDKRGGYSSLNLNYKSGRGDSKGHGKSGGHGMQSLGRVGPTIRRMPNPASLPSLRSENSGNDPSVALVPAGGSGWKSSGDNKEKEEVSSNNVAVTKPPAKDVAVTQPPKPVQKGPKGPPESPGRMFKSEFPSLGEQGGMSKRELEERQRSHKEKGGGERGRGEPHGADGWQQGPSEKHWRDHGPPGPPGPHGHPMRPPPPPGGGHFGQYPPQGPYPPYMMPPPPPRGQGPPYPNMPPPSMGGSGRGRGGHYPPPPMHYRPHYPPPYQQNPYEMPVEKYRGHHGDDDVARPPTIKADKLQQLDVGEEDVGGWAGHHEEVDYSKEVVFSDSSDEESEMRETTKSKDDKTTKSKEQTVSPAKKPPKDQTESFPRQSKSLEQSRNQRSHDRPPHEGEPHDMEGPPRHNMPPFPPYPPYQYYPGYPPPPPPPPQMYPHRPPFQMPPAQHGYIHSRYAHNRGNADDLDWRRDEEERPKQRDDKNLIEERPRILTKPRSSADQEVESVLKNIEDKSLSMQRTVSSSSDTPKHVTFEETQSPPIEESEPHAPTRRALPKRVMLRKMSDPEADSQPEKSSGRRTHAKDPGNVRTDSMGEDSEPLTPDGESKSKPMAWSTGKLYEPEGKKSAAKFMKYQAQSRGRKDSRGSQGSTTPTAEIEGRPITPELKSKTEKHSESNRAQSRSPVDLPEKQNKSESDKPYKTHQDRGPKSYKDDRHDKGRGDKGQRDPKRTSENQKGHQKGKEVSRTDSGRFEKSRDNRRNDPFQRNEERIPYEQRRDKPRRERGARNNTPEKKTDFIEHSKQTESESTVETLQPRVKTPTTNKPPADSRPTDRGQRNTRGERSSKGNVREREGIGRGRHPRTDEERRSQQHDGRRGPSKQPPRERDNRGPPSQRRKQMDDNPSSNKDTIEKGYPAHGYAEVFDIESDLELTDNTPVKQADPHLTVPQRARERQPLLPTPSIEKRAVDPTRNTHSFKDTPKRHAKTRDGESEEKQTELPYTDLREKIRGNAEARSRNYDGQRERRNNSENYRTGSRKHQQSGEFSLNKNRNSDKTGSDSDRSSKASLCAVSDKLDSIPSDGSLQQSQSSKDFSKYDLNSHGIVIIDELNPSSLEGRFSPSTQGEFTEVTSKKAQKEKKHKEKEEQRKLEEKQKEEEKRKRKQTNRSSTDSKGPPSSDNKPHNAWTNPSWKDTPLPKSSFAPGSQLTKSFSSTTSVGVIGQTLPSKETVPHTAELKSTDVEAYTLFGKSTLPPFPTSSYPVTASGPGLLESALDSAVTSPPASNISQAPATVTEKVSKKRTPSEKLHPKPQSELKSRQSSGPAKTEPAKLSKNLPPRFSKSHSGATGGSGRGRSRREGRERRPGRQSADEQGDVAKESVGGAKEQGKVEQSRTKSSGRSTSASNSTHQTDPPRDTERFYVHPQRRGNAAQDDPSKAHPPSKVVPVEDHTPRVPPRVSVATGQQPLRAGSSVKSESVKSEGVSVSKSETTIRPMSSSSSSTTNSYKMDCNKSKGAPNRPISTTQQTKNVSISFSYAQALKSSSTPSSTQISSRSVTPPISPFSNQRWTDDKSLPSSPSMSLPSETRAESATCKDEPNSLSQSEISSINEDLKCTENVIAPYKKLEASDGVEVCEKCTVGAPMTLTDVVTSETDRVSLVDINSVVMTTSIVTVARVDPVLSVVALEDAQVEEEIITKFVECSINDTNSSVQNDSIITSSKDEMSSETVCSANTSQVVNVTSSEVIVQPEVVPIKAHPLPTAHVLPMPHTTVSNPNTMIPSQPYTLVPSHPHTSHFMPPHPHTLTTVPPSLHVNLSHPRVHPPTLHTQQLILPPHPRDVTKHTLMSSPAYLSEPVFTGNPAVFARPPGIPMPPPGCPVPPPAPPIMSTKSHEQLEAIAKVKEYMAVTNAIDAQRKSKTSSNKIDAQQSNTGIVQRPFPPNLPANVGLIEPPVVRPPDLYPPQYSSAAVPMQGLYQKPLLSQPPPPVRTQALLPGGTGEFPPQLAMSMTPQQLATLHILLQQQQARKIAASNAYALSQSGSFGPQGQGYSMPHSNPQSQGNLSAKSAFTPYRSRNSAKSARSTVQLPSPPQTQPQAKPVETLPEKSPQELVKIDEKETEQPEDDDNEQCADSVKSGLSVTATPFVPSSVPENTSKRQQIMTAKTTEVTSTTPERPLLPSPGAMYRPSLPMRPPQATPPFVTMPQSMAAAAFMQRPQLPMPLPQQIVTSGIASYQRKISLGTVPPSQVIHGVSDVQLLAYQQHKQLMERGMYLAKQPEVMLQTPQMPMEMLHIGQKKGYFTSKNTEQQVKHTQHRVAPHKIRSKSDAPQLNTLVPMTATPRRTALLPTPSSATLLVANAPRLTQSAQQWHGNPPQVLSMPQNPAALLTPEQVQRVNSLYTAGLNARPTGHRY